MLRLIRKITPAFLLHWYHASMPLIGALIYRFPSRKIKVIGITGTNGKSTTVEMVSAILKEAGYKIGVLSSIKFEIADKSKPNMLKMTMPGRMTIQKILRRAVDAKCDYLVLEVTSEGLKQNRHLFINFDVALITNLSPEHIEAHGGFENYKKAKGMLFKAVAKTHILNLDDNHLQYFLEFPSEKKWGYGINFEEADYLNKMKIARAVDCETSSHGISFRVGNTNFKIGIPGEFNIYNALAAIMISLSQGIKLEAIKKALEDFGGVEGRMEEIISSPFRVFVDYAFTPNALEKVYKTIKEDFNSKKMICVLGSCGGGRDKWKRPVLGGIANDYCNEVIVTNEDPYDEDPAEIINQVAEEVDKPLKIMDRREAIRKALSLGRDGDAIIITGKGNEPWMCVAGDKKIPWDDKKIVEEEFLKLNKNKSKK